MGAPALVIEDRQYQIDAAHETGKVIIENFVWNKPFETFQHPVCVCPTGAGKSVILCKIIDYFLSKYPQYDVAVISHDSEILKQNHAKLVEYMGCNKEDIGLYSAELGSRTTRKITVAGIASVYNKTELFEKVGLVLVDECHLVNSENKGMYRSFLAAVKACCAGLTATPFRTKQGYIYKNYKQLKDEPVFNCVAYDLSSFENYNMLVDEGYLSPMISVPAKYRMDTSDIKILGDDFNNKQLDDKFNQKDITIRIVKRIVKIGKLNNRKKWLVFAMNTDHAEEIKLEMLKLGVMCETVHSKKKTKKGDYVQDFRDGKYQCLITVNQLTTGTDVPEIDLIADCRPSLSPIYHVQGKGRGGRVAPWAGKVNCMILDFAGNTRRHGPINDVKIQEPGTKRSGKVIDIRAKECPNCKSENSIRNRYCDACGEEFARNTKLEPGYFEGEILKKNNEPKPCTIYTFNVDSVQYEINQRRGKTSSLRVTYRCGYRSFTEFVCIDHKGWPGQKGRKWAYNRFLGSKSMAPENLTELLHAARAGDLKQPRKIKVDIAGKYTEFLEHYF